MNPLAWKREHQIALAVAVSLGATVGCILGVVVTPKYVNFQWGALWCDQHVTTVCVYLLQGYWLLILFWIALGGAFGAGIVYVRQLLRA